MDIHMDLFYLYIYIYIERERERGGYNLHRPPETKVVCIAIMMKLCMHHDRRYRQIELCEVYSVMENPVTVKEDTHVGLRMHARTHITYVQGPKAQ